MCNTLNAGMFYNRSSQFISTLISIEAPVTFTVQLQDQTVTEDEDLTLTCEVSKPEVKVIWMKDGKKIKSGDRYEMRSEGCVHMFMIRGLTMDDAAEYGAKVANEKTVAKIEVKGNGRNLVGRKCQHVTYLRLHTTYNVINRF